MSITETDDPIALFKEWLSEAEGLEQINPNAMALATATPDGRPSVRMVLLKAVDDRGFVFYTNAESRKGRELAANAQASLCFYWKSLRRQVRIDGAVSPVSDEEADAYFDSRDRGARIGAWASAQSRSMEGRFDLEKNIAKYAAKFNVGAVPRPEYWRGYRVAPEVIEFWVERKSRLHDRWAYHQGDGGVWTMEILFP
ncbi:MAG: pyridoxamine 5'-phosphate oxidase [Rhodospirillaceae bacterium]|jgi:pyridoxamine 5'-phosphate oxidase|nr:pyridoxamine 5'-phosphate oxidase [Alphaproteobacteria bacterium]MBT5751852.1 pyridoxamine 5'-phosphate oxidase [Rhodospirillaceae bacterium]